MPTSVPFTSKPRRSAFTLVEVLMALFIIAVLAALLSRILQSSMLSHRQIKNDLAAAPSRQAQINRQFAGESEEKLITLTPVKQEAE